MFILQRTLCNRRRVDLLKHSPVSRFFTAAISQSFVVRLRLRGEPNKSRVECACADAPAARCLLSLREPAMRDCRQVTVIVMFTRAAPDRPSSPPSTSTVRYRRFEVAAAV